MRKWVVLLVIVGCVFLGYKYLYKDHRNIASELPFATLNSTSLIKYIADNPDSVQNAYLNRTIQVHGRVTHSSKETLTLDQKIFCLLINDLNSEVLNGTEITIKGRFIGYDDLLDEIKIDQCHIIIKN